MGWSLLLLLSVATAPAWASVVEADPPEAAVRQGRLLGFWMKSRQDRPIAAFQGIPYAKPPVGALRFQAPEPPESWTGVRNATPVGPVCTHRSLFSRQLMGGEDCLFLNVYVPNKIDTSRRFAVMVYIHGGGFVSGAGHFYGPEYILDQDVLLVNFNYRLGPLGFLSTNDEVIPGNYGLKDMVQALRWVQENIAHFGGDPGSVTIFGESAGGSSVHHLIMSPLAKGLFHKAISMSGTAISNWAMATPGEQQRNGNALAKYLNCPSEPSNEFKKCLMTKSAFEITSSDLSLQEYGLFPSIPFKPTVERDPGAFHKQHPIETLTTSGPVNDVPYMTGFVTQEGCLFACGIFSNNSAVQDFSNRFDYLVPLGLFVEHYPKPSLKRDSETIRHFYFGDKPINMAEVSNGINLFSDSLFIWPAIESAKLHVKHGKSPMYVYHFDQTTSASYSTFLGMKESIGICHGDDNLFLFPLDIFPTYKPSDDDLDISNKLVGYVTSFAIHGRPTEDGSWRSAQHSNGAEYMHIKQGQIEMRANYTPERMAFWSNLETFPTYKASLHSEL